VEEWPVAQATCLGQLRVVVTLGLGRHSCDCWKSRKRKRPQPILREYLLQFICIRICSCLPGKRAVHCGSLHSSSQEEVPALHLTLFGLWLQILWHPMKTCSATLDRATGVQCNQQLWGMQRQSALLVRPAIPSTVQHGGQHAQRSIDTQITSTSELFGAAANCHAQPCSWQCPPQDPLPKPSQTQHRYI
jgi:hypothetical protein